MAGSGETDAVTGVETTGHEWDGIKELDNPMPSWWLWTFYVSIAVAVVMWVLLPSWPSLSGYLGGLMGSDQRIDLEQRMEVARAEQAAVLDRIAASTPSEIAADPDLLTFAVLGGGAAFANNCAPCHGLGGAGQLHYPSLADDAWIWGGTMEEIEATIRHGIRNDTDDEARFNLMPAFGADQILTREEVDETVAYVLSLAGRDHDEAAADAVDAGAVLFEDNCAACHGDDGKGMLELGGPDLTDAIWLYGEQPAEIAAQVSNPRHGVMPAWQGRLPEETINMLTVYVHSLGGGQ